MFNEKLDKEFARQLRIDALKMVHKAHASHIGAAFSIADVMSVLFNDVLNYNKKKKKNDERDRFVLSKGHAGCIYYAALAEKGFFDKSILDNYDENGSPLSGHISHKGVPGVEFSTGSLGHGACVACGMALAGKLDNKDYRVFSIVGDGECDEGSIWEMAFFAVQYKLNNFYLIIDRNKMQAMGNQEDVLNTGDLRTKFENIGWKAVEVDGHNYREIYDALNIKTENQPICIVCDTTKGKGVSFMENNLVWHYRDPQGADFEKALSELEEAK